MSETRKQWEDEADGHKPSHFDAGQVKNQSEQFPLTSAEEWGKRFPISLRRFYPIRQVQLEAIKHGMELAAGIANKSEHALNDGGCFTALHNCQKAILTAAKEFKL